MWDTIINFWRSQSLSGNQPTDSVHPDLPALVAPHLGLWNIFGCDVQRGVNVNCHDSHVMTALHVAVRNLDLDGLSWLLSQRGLEGHPWPGRTVMGGRCWSAAIVNSLLEKGIDVDRRDNNGRTAAHGQHKEVEVFKVAFSK